MSADRSEYIETAIEQAAETLLWQATDVSENGGDGFPLSDDNGHVRGETQVIERVIAEVPYLTEAVTAFVTVNWETLLSANVSADQCGQDFILTANRHGAGFWDRGLGDAGDKLTEAAHGYSLDAEFALDDDGEIAWLMVENTVLVDNLGWSAE